MLARSPRALVASLALALTILVPAAASARAHAHDLNVWTDTTVGDGDRYRDVTIAFGTLLCDGPAEIDGDVSVFFGTFDPQGQCKVHGTVTNVFGQNALEGFTPWTNDSDSFFEHAGLLHKLGWDLVVMLAFLMFPVRMRVALDRVEKHPGVSALAGGIALVAAIPIGVLLLLSIIGIPLIPLELAALFAGLWIGQGAVALLLGRRFYELLRPHDTPSPFGALLIGLALVTAAETLPVVGWAVAALVALMGLGAAMLAFVRETAFHAVYPAAPPPSGGMPSGGMPSGGMSSGGTPIGRPPIGGPPMPRPF